MSETLPTYQKLAARLMPHGLLPRGGFSIRPGEIPRPLSNTSFGASGGTLIMIGNAGPSMWDAFSKHQSNGENALDEWTRQILSPIALEFGADVLFPWSEPYYPFQQWAMRAEPVHPSPLGILIHPDHGLWHAYRAAFVFPFEVELPAQTSVPSPCETCEEKPCLSSCPVDAFKHGAYHVEVCADHISQPSDQQMCRGAGCLARAACPVGVPYGGQQIRFHMNAFYASRAAT